MGWWWWISAAVVAGTFGLAIGFVARDERADELLSPASVGLVWGAYGLHAVLTVALAWAAPLGRVGVSPGLAHVLGGVLVGAGGWIAFESVMTFHSLARMSGRDTSTLVRGGIYAFSRNPQNLGWWVVLLGVAVLGRSPAALASALLFAAVLHTYIVVLEEPYLERLYGEAYRAYRRGSGRYLAFRDPANE